MRGGPMTAHFRAGDCVIYRKPKVSARPGRHAQDIHPARPCRTPLSSWRSNPSAEDRDKNPAG